MKHCMQRTILFLVFVVLVIPALATGATLYVDDDGSDGAGSNDCTAQGTPCKTISYALTKITTDGTAGSPHVINIAAGSYIEGVPTVGEVYPINVIKDYISLVGTDASTTEIVGKGIGYILSVTSTGLSVQNIKFSNAGTAVNISGGYGGFSFSNNIFAASVDTGVYASVYPATASTDVTIMPVSFTGNNFACPDYGVDIKMGITFDGTTTGLTGAVGSITATGNTFTNTSSGFMLDEVYITSMKGGTATIGNINLSNNTFTNSSYGYEINTLYVDDMEGSTVTWGTVNIDNNIMTDISSTGIKFEGYFGSDSDPITDTNLTMGNVSVSNNTFTDNSGTAIQIDYFDVAYLYGASIFLLGDLVVHNNTIETDTSPAAGYGLYISDIGDITDIYDTSTVTTGTVTITDNTVESYYRALRLDSEGAYDIGIKGGTDTVQVDLGPMNIKGNHLTSTSDNAAYLSINYFGYRQYAQTKVNGGLITLHDNDMISTDTDDALEFYYYYESGYELFNDAQVTLAGLTFTNNRIASSGSYGAYIYMNELGYDLHDNAKMTVGPSTITGNTITGYYDALYLYFYDVAYYMYGSSMLTMSPWTVSNNTLTATYAPEYAAFTIYYYEYAIGSYMVDNSKATLPDWIIKNNTIDTKGDYEGLEFFNEDNSYDNYNLAYVDFGSILIDGNTFNPNKDTGMNNGIYIYVYEAAGDTHDQATTVYGDVTITNNKIYNVGSEGIYLDYDGFPYAAYDSTTFVGGNFDISNNVIAGADYGISLEFDYLEVNHSGTATVGTFNVADNTLTDITSDGVWVYMETDNHNPTTASLTVGATTVKNNTITADAGGASNGIYFYGDISYTEVTFGMPVLSGNTATGFSNGIYLEGGTNEEGLDKMSITCNWLQNNTKNGIRFVSEGKNFTVMTNSIAGNTAFGLSVDNGYAAVINAEKNWWGDGAGPAACASCNGVNPGDLGTVDFTPWLTSEPIKKSCGAYKFPWTMFLPAIMGAGK